MITPCANVLSSEILYPFTVSGSALKSIDIFGEVVIFFPLFITIVKSFLPIAVGAILTAPPVCGVNTVNGPIVNVFEILPAVSIQLNDTEYVPLDCIPERYALTSPPGVLKDPICVATEPNVELGACASALHAFDVEK